MNWNVAINRAFIASNACFRGILNRIHLNRTTNKNENHLVIIVFQQAFGDAVVLQNSLGEYVKLYPKEKGYRVLLLAQPSVLDFMQSVLILPEALEMEKVDFKRFLVDYKYYKKIVKKYQNSTDLLIIPGDSLSGEIFSAANNARRKIAGVKYKDFISPFVMAAFNRIAFTEKVRPQKEDMMLQQHRRLLNYLRDDDFKASLPCLQNKEKVVTDDHYCVICPGASLMEKCWPTDRYAQVADYIIEKYNMNIYLCGGLEETEFETIMLSFMSHPERVISHIGKTSFSDWSAIVQHADIVLGNDSATLHLAAAARRKAICITGIYDKYLFFPYKVDVLAEGDCLPVTIIKDMPCAWCRTEGYYSGFGNEECKKCISEGKCSLCIDAIKVDEVIVEVDNLLGDA